MTEEKEEEMEMFWQVVEKHQRVTIPELSVTLRRVTKEHYVPTEDDIAEALEEGSERPEEEVYFADTKDYLEQVVSEGEWMSLELGAVYGSGLTLVERESEVV